jgi:hypothetical protein
MTQSPSVSTTAPSTSDRLTLIAISALASVAGVGLHEHLGHALTCVLLGGHPTELGAFYITCDYTGLSELRIRLVALAGPMVSLAIGVVCFLVLRVRPPAKPNAYFFTWLLGTFGLMSATGYPLFSGVTGLGDFGTSPDGFIYQVSPEWLWRIILTLIGTAGYLLIIRLAVHEIDPHISGVGRPRIRYARLLVLTSYLTGVGVAIGIGLLNPHGPIIVVISSAAGTLGGSSGLLWMMQLLDRERQVPEPGLVIQRSWGWIALGAVVTIVYGLVFGPTLRF